MKKSHREAVESVGKRPEITWSDYNFEVQPISKFQGKFPFFRQPSEVGSFCYDADRIFVHDRCQLRYYVSPPNPDNTSFDLRSGYNIFIQKDETLKCYLNNLLKWVQLNREKFTVSGLNDQDKR